MKTMITKTTQNETKNFLRSFITKASITFALASTLTLSALAGPISDGGGNAVNYKLIQSYQTNIRNLESVTTLKPALDNLKIKLPNFYKQIINKSRSIAFYLIPKKMKTVAEEYTGLPFSSDQLAVNKITNNEVFLDNDIFSKMSKEEQGRVFLHEVLESLTLNNTYENDIQRAMAFVRQATNIISYELDLSPDEMRNLLTLPLDNISVKNEYFANMFDTPETIEKKLIEKAKIDEERFQLKKEKTAVLDFIFSKYENFCAKTKNIEVISLHQYENELKSNEKQILLTELSNFDELFYLSYLFGERNIDNAHKRNIKVADIKNIQLNLQISDKLISREKARSNMNLDYLIGEYSVLKLNSYELKSKSSFEFNNFNNTVFNSLTKFNDLCKNMLSKKDDYYRQLN